MFWFCLFCSEFGLKVFAFFLGRRWVVGVWFFGWLVLGYLQWKLLYLQVYLFTYSTSWLKLKFSWHILYNARKLQIQLFYSSENTVYINSCIFSIYYLVRNSSHCCVTKGAEIYGLTSLNHKSNPLPYSITFVGLFQH